MSTDDSVRPTVSAASEDEARSVLTPSMHRMPDNVGPYRVLELLGQGGMGMVYKAEQRTPVRRTVAVKVVKLGLDTVEVMGRFESERQALARMDHPGIARVLDAGADDRGRPYFVMEYVPGVPITTYADREKLPIKERLELFLQVCDAIAHAHAKAILHRDIKSTNVLAYTDSAGHRIAKVIDFGVAKALTSDRLTDITFNTQRGLAVGTYESMSPEQADGSPDIDSRTDVYALGVLLYELLAGEKPLGESMLAGTADAEIRRVIHDVDPPRPSVRLTSLTEYDGSKVAAARRSATATLARELKSELEWIPMMCLRKERDRRYHSPLLLAADIRNYLEGLPLQAGPDTRRYRLNKLMSRNKGIIAAGAAVFAMLLLGIAGTTAGMVRASHQKQQAEQARAVAEKNRAEADLQRLRTQAEQDNTHAVMTFMSQDVFGGSGQQALGPELATQLTKLLDGPAVGMSQHRFKDQPLVVAAVNQLLADTLLGLGHPDLARKRAEESLEIRKKLLPDEDPSTISSMDTQARVLAALNLPVLAEPLASTVWAHRNYRDAMATLESGFNYGALLMINGKPAAAVPVLKEVCEQCRQRLGIEDARSLQVQLVYAQSLMATGKTDQAVPLLTETWWVSRRIIGYGRRITMTAMVDSARALVLLDRLDAAEEFCKYVYEWRLNRWGPTAPETISDLTTYATVLWKLQRYRDAEPLFKALLDDLTHSKSPSDAALADARIKADECARLRDQSKTVAPYDFEKQYAGALVAADRAGRDGHDFSELTGTSLVADACNAMQHWADADTLYEKIIAGRRRQNPPDLSAIAVDQDKRSHALLQLKRYDQAVACLRDVLEIDRDRLGPSDRATIAAATALADALDASNKPESAERVRSEYGIKVKPKTPPDNLD